MESWVAEIFHIPSLFLFLFLFFFKFLVVENNKVLMLQCIKD